MTRVLGARVRGSGRPVLFVHGFPFHGGQWSATLDVAPAIAARCITPDLAGFGESPFGARAPEVVTMENYADDLAATLDALDVTEPVILVGFSMGGYVAWQFLRRHRARVRALVMCNTRAIADTHEGATGRLAMAQRVLAEGPAALIEGMLPKLLAPETLAQRPDVVREVRGLMEAPARGESGPAKRAIAAALRGMAQRPDSTPLLREIDVPALVIVGEHDALSSPQEMRGIAASIPGARCVEIARAGHMTTHETPAELAAHLHEFCAAH
jgi:pimeloyl-ACP methyl ester carboxylesterase